MIKATLNTLYEVNQEIERLSKLKNTGKGKLKFQSELAELRKIRAELISKEYLEKLEGLSLDELDMAKKHYYEGKGWNDAYKSSKLGIPKNLNDNINGIPQDSAKKRIVRVIERTSIEDLKSN